MPLFDYRCTNCHEIAEVFLRSPGTPVVPCPACGSVETVRLVSSFSLKLARQEKYTEEFREKALPFLKSRPGAQDYFNQSGESEEAKAYKLTERIGERIDTALEQKVFRNL